MSTDVAMPPPPTPPVVSPRRLRPRRTPNVTSDSTPPSTVATTKRKRTTTKTKAKGKASKREIHVKEEVEAKVKVEPGVNVEEHVAGIGGSGPTTKKARTTKKQVVKQSVQVKQEVKTEPVATAASWMPADIPLSASNHEVGTDVKPALDEKGKGKIKAEPGFEYPQAGSTSVGDSKVGKAPVAASSSKKQGEEKRSKRFRDKAPQTILQRAARVRSQRMFMIDREKLGDLSEKYQVLGSTGNVYTVHIDSEPKCSCPDFQNGNSPCKHVIFVFLKVLKVPETSILWFQKALLSTELCEIFAMAPPTALGSVAVSTTVRDAYRKATGVDGTVEETTVEVEKEIEAPAEQRKISSIGDDCPVCYEEMTEKDDKKRLIIYDDSLAGCGRGLHKQCFNQWSTALKRRHEPVTCVWCRAPWPVDAGQAHRHAGPSEGIAYNSRGYLNLANIAGISRDRDTSTYHLPQAWARRYTDSFYATAGEASGSQQYW